MRVLPPRGPRSRGPNQPNNGEGAWLWPPWQRLAFPEAGDVLEDPSCPPGQDRATLCAPEGVIWVCPKGPQGAVSKAGGALSVHRLTPRSVRGVRGSLEETREDNLGGVQE